MGLEWKTFKRLQGVGCFPRKTFVVFWFVFVGEFGLDGNGRIGTCVCGNWGLFDVCAPLLISETSFTISSLEKQIHQSGG